MSWTNLKLIFLRELRDQLRDRRTLFMILVLPILLYPGIGIGIMEFMVSFAEQPRLVAVFGADALPDSPPLIEQDRFVADLFGLPDDVEKLRIVKEPSIDEAKRKLESGELQLILVVPSDIREQLSASRGFKWESIAYKAADDKSRVAYLLLREVLENWKETIVRDRVGANPALTPDFANPFKIAPEDISTPQQLASGMVWAKLFPFLLVIMALTGAFNPAVDLCAGEKERGTMETLLITPASRGEIVMGKYFTICLFSFGTAVLNLLSMAATGWVVARNMAGAVAAKAPIAMLAPPSGVSAVWMLVLLVPLAAFFSALSIALAVFARSSKEGQYYLTPLFLVTMPLVLVVVLPGTALDAFSSMVPVSGAALLLKALIQGEYDVALEFFLPVLLPTVLYAALALRWAIDQFSREEVLFREAERVDLWLWARHLLRDRGAYPSAAEAMFCYAIMLLLVWFLVVGGFVGPSAGVEGADRSAVLQRFLIVMQVAFIASPAIMMALMLTTHPAESLLLRRGPWKLLALAVLLAVALHPITMEASHLLHRETTSQSKGIEEHFQEMLSGQPLWWQIVLIALLPAICEELAFRGFILSGLLRRMSAPMAIVVTAFLFGFYHMNPHQLLNATALGVVLGVIATRSGSLLAAIAFHFTNNSLVLLVANFHDRAVQAKGEHAPSWLFQALYRETQADQVTYQVPVLLLSAVAATAALTWLLRQPIRSPGVGDDAGPADQDQAPLAFSPSERDAFGLGAK